VGDEECAHESGLDGGNEDTAAHVAKPLEPMQVADNTLERLDAVAQPRGILIATAIGEVAQART
jgi:hypothetical protein